MAESINVVISGVAWLQELAPTEEGPEMWDVEVRHDRGVTLRAHNLILSEHSAFFREAFADKSYVDLKEKEDGVSLGTLRAVLNSIYRIPFKVDAQNVYEVLATANYLQIEQICDDCCAFLKSRLNVGNAMSTWQEAYGREFRGSTDLQGACAGFIFENFKEIYSRDEFTELKPEELKALLSHRPATRVKESIVVDAVITWLNKTWTTNFREAPGFIAEIRWNKVWRAQLAKIKSVEEFAKMKCTSAEEKPIKVEIVELLLNPRRDSTEKEPSKIVAISKPGWNDYNMSEYCLAAREWTSRFCKLSLPVGQGEHLQTAFAFQGCVVLVSGSTKLTGDSLKAHVLEQGQIHESITLSIPEHCLAKTYIITFSEPFICLTLGDEQLCVRKIILYDVRHLLPAQEEVSDIPAIPVHQTIDVTSDTLAARTTWSKAVYFQDEVHLFGGSNCNEVIVFSLSSDAWRRGPSTHQSCCNNWAYRCVVDGVLYSAGGFVDHHECSKTFERFDPTWAAEGWVKGPDLVKGCKVLSHYVRDGRLFLVGVVFEASTCTRTTVVQSIDLDQFTVGWRDESTFFAGFIPEHLITVYAFAVVS